LLKYTKYNICFVKVWVILLAIIPITAFGLAAVDHRENGGVGDFKALLKYYGVLIMKSLLSQSKHTSQLEIYIYFKKLNYVFQSNQVRSLRQVLNGNYD